MIKQVFLAATVTVVGGFVGTDTADAGRPLYRVGRPVVVAPGYRAPRVVYRPSTLRYAAPVYHAAPVYRAPVYTAPVYVAPRYVAPSYRAPMYGGGYYGRGVGGYPGYGYGYGSSITIGRGGVGISIGF